MCRVSEPRVWFYALAMTLMSVTPGVYLCFKTVDIFNQQFPKAWDDGDPPRKWRQRVSDFKISSSIVGLMTTMSSNWFRNGGVLLLIWLITWKIWFSNTFFLFLNHTSLLYTGQFLWRRNAESAHTLIVLSFYIMAFVDDRQVLRF